MLGSSSRSTAPCFSRESTKKVVLRRAQKQRTRSRIVGCLNGALRKQIVARETMFHKSYSDITLYLLLRSLRPFLPYLLPSFPFFSRNHSRAFSPYAVRLWLRSVSRRENTYLEEEKRGSFGEARTTERTMSDKCSTIAPLSLYYTYTSSPSIFQPAASSSCRRRCPGTTSGIASGACPTAWSAPERRCGGRPGRTRCTARSRAKLASNYFCRRLDLNRTLSNIQSARLIRILMTRIYPESIYHVSWA